MPTQTAIDDLDLLTRTLPSALQEALQPHPLSELLEIVMDLGRPAQARFPQSAVDLAAEPVTRDDLRRVVESVGDFGADNRAGIEGTLHRISAVRNRRGDIIGLTLRVGRAVFGTIDQIRDLVESGKGLLLLGPPGVGKTTKLREVARVLADDLGKRVIVIDTSNEIAGDGDIPHPAIGGARRMMVPHPDHQHAVMIEAVENHMPEVIIVDEIGTASETMAARTIAERGVQLIGTAHGNTLQNLLSNPTLSDLVGGVQAVTLGDEEARLRRTQKTVSERKGAPTFDVVVELVERDEVIVHADTAQAVDDLLSGIAPQGIRRRAGAAHPAPGTPIGEAHANGRTRPPDVGRTVQGPRRIFVYALNPDSVERAIRDLSLDARTVRYPDQADLALALRSRAADPRLQRLAADGSLPIHSVKNNTTAQIRHVLRDIFNVVHGEDRDTVHDAAREAERAAQQVKDEGIAQELAPRPSTIRRLQHRIVTRHGLVAESVGIEPHRYLVIFPV